MIHYLFQVILDSRKENKLINSQNMLDQTYFIRHIELREYKFRVEFYRVTYFFGIKTGFETHFIGNFSTIDEAKSYVDTLRKPIILKNL